MSDKMKKSKQEPSEGGTNKAIVQDAFLIGPTQKMFEDGKIPTKKVKVIVKTLHLAPLSLF